MDPRQVLGPGLHREEETMFEPFPGNYVWNLSTNIALNTGAQLNEVLDSIGP